MRCDFSKALENIRKAMHEQDEDFRREEGLGPKRPKPQPKIPSLKPETDTSQGKSDGKLPPDRPLTTSINLKADRFLKTSINQEHTHEPETLSTTQNPGSPHVQNNAPEIVEVIPQKDSRHSWLYNEVAKAVQNASDGNPNTKVVAVFVPVVQSGHEFEDMPVHETVELPPVHEDDFRIEDDIDFQEDTETPDELPHDSEEQELLAEETPQPEVQELFTEEASQPEVQELFTEETPQPEVQELFTEEPTQPEMQEQQDLTQGLASEPEQADHLGELIPESMEHPDPELAEAFNTMEEILDEHIAAANEELPELQLPDELEDDEIIDDIYESSEDSKAK